MFLLLIAGTVDFGVPVYENQRRLPGGAHAGLDDRKENDTNSDGCELIFTVSIFSSVESTFDKGTIRIKTNGTCNNGDEIHIEISRERRWNVY
ncbi:hypothetical protein KIN20_002654 [Parelaphostrongylus tenuis]|uniref:Uncharacterized protein n=1 Tax=Parelaphostrongylus tenuis TaxID=148309 RepID=A0AAD5MNW0_PARTN|nr:hypothetical protein KIN20_002654 [Parelaphostrongylus tenuis]